MIKIYYLMIFSIVYIIYNQNILNYFSLKLIKISSIFYITSAFYDYRINSIRILFAAKLKNEYSLKIIINGKSIENYTNIIYDECKGYDKYFDLKYGNIIIPNTIFTSNVYINNNKFPIIYNKGKEKYFLSVCITTMYNYYAKLMFKQLLDIYINLGVEHFTIYYSSSSVDILNLINIYERKHLIKLIYWERNNASMRMRNYGQYIKTNDCLYRYLNVSRYIINTDLDEILIPLKFTTLIEYIYYINKFYLNTTVILFSSKMFIKNESIDYQTKNRKTNYLNLHKISDADIFSITKCCYSYNNYRKYIVHVKDMIALDTHKPLNGIISIYNVPYNEGYSRHTRRLVFFISKFYCKKIENDNNLTMLLPSIYKKYHSIV